jgi:hypothetical protein
VAEAVGAGVAVALPSGCVAAAGVACPSAGAAGLAAGAGVGCALAPLSISERWPLPTPTPSKSATRKKVAAATMVILARMVCVPRGPQAVLEIELVKSEPASALPGCKSTETTSTMQAKMKSP